MLQAAESRRAAIDRIVARTMLGVRHLWLQLGDGDFNDTWPELWPRVVTIITAGQIAAARGVDTYTDAILDEQGTEASAVGMVATAAVAGTSGAGLPLDVYRNYPLRLTRIALAKGAPIGDAQAAGGQLLQAITKTQVLDAQRAAESVAITARPAITGYTRHLRLPSCSRCVILAGRFYPWSAGFDRHPRCDCFHTPVSSQGAAHDLVADPLAVIKAGQVGSYRTVDGKQVFKPGLSKAELSAILDDGADPARVINAKRGMSTAQVYGQRMKVTSAGFGNRRSSRTTPRLMPSTIYKIAADDRLEAIRLLRQFGYIIG